MHTDRTEVIMVKASGAIAGIALLGAVGAVVLAPPASAADSYGAIIYSPSTGVSGGSWNYPTIEEAFARARQECLNHPLHPSDCTEGYGVGPPLRCVALAIGADKSRYAFGTGGTQEEAKNDALAALPGTRIPFWLCNATSKEVGGGPGGGSGLA